MIIIDPYIIDAAIAERIEQLVDDGLPLSIGPDEEYGFTCEAVFGVRPDQIAAVHYDHRCSRAAMFQLTNGLFIDSDPGSGAAVSVPDSITEH